MWLPLLVVLGIIYLFRWYRQSLILKKVRDKYVFITGCDSGFGNLLAKQLDRRGMKVLAACLTEVGAENLKKETSKNIQTVILDVTDSQSVIAAVTWVSSVVKDEGLWGLVNNAGTGIPSCNNEWLTKDDFFKIINVNLLGVVDVTLNLLPLIRKARGRVVNVTSVAGRITTCGGGYCMSKYGVESFSDSLRREMHPFGVKVCIIECGYYSTQENSPKLIKESIRHYWKKASEEVQKAYGLEYYGKFYVFTDILSKFQSTKLSRVVDCMEHALTAVHPWTRYSAGWDAKFLVSLSYLPTVVLDFVLTIGRPKPTQAI
ncbi:retinol dehydrogenase 16-like [Pyxicephalus adspersus]|uniref:retinol dehydrogenase 16-like n=1 Tax=Pyxicephalus adspersus TaxID=30357 RepID=UPI003B59BE5D